MPDDVAGGPARPPAPTAPPSAPRVATGGDDKPARGRLGSHYAHAHIANVKPYPVGPPATHPTFLTSGGSDAIVAQGTEFCYTAALPQ